jgi:hypothetical protein
VSSNGGLNELIDLYCILEEVDIGRWKLATKYVVSALQKMRQKDDFTSEQILSFQGDIDEFSQL